MMEVHQSNEGSLMNAIANQYRDMLRTIIENQRAGDSARAYELQDRVMESAGCELWELIEATDVINESVFNGENPFTVEPIERPAGPTIYGASANIHELESRILAKQERDNADLI